MNARGILHRQCDDCAIFCGDESTDIMLGDSAIRPYDAIKQRQSNEQCVNTITGTS